jgi:hypothetical protein
MVLAIALRFIGSTREPWTARPCGRHALLTGTTVTAEMAQSLLILSLGPIFGWRHDRQNADTKSPTAQELDPRRTNIQPCRCAR